MFEIIVISREKTLEERMDKIVTEVSEEFSKDLAEILQKANRLPGNACEPKFSK